MIDLATFDFIKFFDKYNLEYTDHNVKLTLRALEDPVVAVDLCRTTGLKIKEFEEIIKTNRKAILEYAQKVLKERWYEVEDFILQDHEIAAKYAYLIMQDRWPALEKCFTHYSMAQMMYEQYFHLERTDIRWIPPYKSPSSPSLQNQSSSSG